MKDFEKFGVQELTMLEQRGTLGGGPWRTAGRWAGIGARFALDWFEDWLEFLGSEAPAAQYNLDGLVGFSGGG